MAAATGSNLASTALALVADSKGILAADETFPTPTKRNAAASRRLLRRDGTGLPRGGVPVRRGGDD